MKTLPAGLYFVGDPCLILNESYDDFLKNVPEDIISTFKGFDVFYGSSAWGDGIYKDTKGNEYTIDSGMVAIIPAELVEIENTVGGHFITFEDDFDVENECGLFSFGHIIINTDWEDFDAMAFDEPDFINEDAFWEDPMDNNYDY